MAGLVACFRGPSALYAHSGVDWPGKHGTPNGHQSEGGPRLDSTLLVGYPVIVELPVVWGEMDSYRHVNNVVYFRYFENARIEYFRRLDWFSYEGQSGVGGN